jgi:hypothetical protein
VEWVKSLERREAQESNVLRRALNKHDGVTDLQSAVGLEAGQQYRRANGKKASGLERDPRLVVGERLCRENPRGVTD